jgi:hypothetical protein
VLSIVHGGWSLRVVALDQLPDPVAGVARDLGDGGRRVPRGQPPQDLPPAVLMWSLAVR